MAVPSQEPMAAPPEVATATILEQGTSGGSVTVNPTEGVAGEHGTWAVTYRVGPNGIRQHGGIRVELPDSWHSGSSLLNSFLHTSAGGKNPIPSIRANRSEDAPGDAQFEAYRMAAN